ESRIPKGPRTSRLTASRPGCTKRGQREERTMTHRFLRLFAVFAIPGLVAAGTASAEDCRGAITAEEAMKAETARYAAQTANDFAAMEKLFGNDLTYNHSS